MSELESSENSIGNNKVNIHRFADVSLKAELGKGVSVGSGAVIGPNVIIGANSVINSNVNLQDCIIGSNCVIKSGAVIVNSFAVRAVVKPAPPVNVNVSFVCVWIPKAPCKSVEDKS